MFISTVAGSIGTINECRRASVIEESARERANRRCVADKTVPWKTFKSIVFLICVIFLISQSVDFLRIYYTYPTASQQETTVPKNYKLPAITLCFRNTMSFKKFCFYEPKACEKPSNMKEFCREHPFICGGYNTNLTVPNQYETTRRIIQRYLLNDTYNDNDKLFRSYKYASKAKTFVRALDDFYFFLKCYSQNLHLYQSGSKPETMKLNFVGERGEFISSFQLDQKNIEPFCPLDTPQVFFGIHSPYVPLNPEEDLHTVKPGVWYKTYVQLEKEEHLLPPPYQTDCRDNGPSKDAKEFTNPNSFQMCLDLCRSEFYKRMYGCVGGMMMAPTKPDDSCFEDWPLLKALNPEQQDELKKKRLFCFQNCKQGCLSGLEFYVKNPEVTVLRHVPLYGSSEIFSNVGGLLGCWLGVSVFTFTDILEKFFRKVFVWKRRFRKRRITLRRLRRRIEQGAPTSEIHHE